MRSKTATILPLSITSTITIFPNKFYEEDELVNDKIYTLHYSIGRPITL